MTAEAERRIRLTLHYDGAGFRGWQVQPDARTVQADLEAALSRLADRPITTTAAGRTDTGVHATGQVVAARMPANWTAPALRRSLNAILPHDIRVVAADDAPEAFHARYDAIARGYIYRVGTRELAASPFRRRWCWPLGAELDPDVLERTAATLPGERSFRAFSKAGQPERGEICTVHRAGWHEWPRIGVEFRITANRFLHHMVRYLVGTMVDAARGRRPESDMAALLRGEPGLETSPPAPPAGLFLARVYYDERDLETRELTNEDLP